MTGAQFGQFILALIGVAVVVAIVVSPALRDLIELLANELRDLAS
jgi:hypothetical protein